MKALDYCFKLEEKAIGSFQKNKISFISFIGDKFAISIR